MVDGKLAQTLHKGDQGGAGAHVFHGKPALGGMPTRLATDIIFQSRMEGENPPTKTVPTVSS